MRLFTTGVASGVAAVAIALLIVSFATGGARTAATKSYPVTVHADYEVLEQGTPMPTPTGVTINDRALRGRFYPSGSRKTGPAPPFNPTQFSPGDVVLQFDATFTGPNGKGEGLVVARHDNKQAGMQCSKLSLDITNGGQNAKGTLTSIGGTRTQSKLSPKITVESQQTGSDSFTANGTGKATVRKKPKGLTAECRTLANKLP